MYPIEYYLKQNIYAYYNNKQHIIFDDNLSYLLEQGLKPIKVSSTKIIFL